MRGNIYTMDKFLKIFVIFTVIAVLILSTITVYQFVLKPNDGDLLDNAILDASENSQQQEIVSMSDPEQSFTSGTVKLQVSDLLNEGKTFEDPSNSGNYILHGDLGYCLNSGKCLNNSKVDNFSIWFDARDSVFYISLLAQPVATARLDAESFLLQTFDLTPAELCKISYYMSASSEVDVQASGQHLRFSFCTGAQNI